MSLNLRTIDLFCGCGGFSLGFRNAGYSIVAAFDHWQPALRTYRANMHDHTAYEYDLSTMHGDEPLIQAYGANVIIGGPPCQDFSSAGKRDEGGGRADLTTTFAAIVATARPQWFVMENVERAATSRAFDAARAMFKRAGYGLSETVLDASRCGVPQVRKRLFMIGERGGQDGAVLPYLLRNLAAKPMTVHDYFGERIDLNHYYRHPRSYARRGVFSIDEPSPTIRGVNRPIPPLYKPHPGDTAPPSSNLRPLTTQERAMIQTFPPHWVWNGTKADVEQMIGNAVPVKLAEYVARCLVDYMERKPMPSHRPMEQLALDLDLRPA